MSVAEVDLTCSELVELITDYLENSLPADQRVRFDQHLAICEGCRNYVDQMRTTIALTGALKEQDIPSTARARLLSAFRGWSRGA
jgi:predicted anti-sigma-YlaC factor YlaD